ncbi:hypothetical protein AB4431_11225 [Vibrio artabrorum]|uniref:hypothetical protein n=1 Tax=Vibrio artabrorum TaxID=446374 RepID=UPI00354DBD81
MLVLTLHRFTIQLGTKAEPALKASEGFNNEETRLRKALEIFNKKGMRVAYLLNGLNKPVSGSNQIQNPV